MMRTEDDVRQALREREREAAPAAEVLPQLQVDARGQGHGRGRAYSLIVAACVAVAGVVVVAVFVAGRHADRSGTFPSPAAAPTVTSSLKMPLGPKFEFSIAIGQLPAGYEALNQQIGGIEIQGMPLR